MKHSIQSCLLAATAALVLFGASPAQAQPADFDPAEIRQRMMDRYREQLGVTSDDEWKVIQARIEKVTETRMALQPFNTGGFGRGGFGVGRGGRGGGQGGGGRGGRGGGFFGQPNPAVTALQDAVEANASADELKAKVAAYRAERKAKEDALAKAQNELKELLSAKQEAAALTMGLVQ